MTTELKRVRARGTDKPSGKKLTKIEKRYLRIQKEAYYLAQKDSFKRDPIVYWLEAEAVAGAQA